MKRIAVVIFACVFAMALRAHPAPSESKPIAADPTAGGRVLLGELNCTACHRASESQAAWLSPKAAPLLKEIGSRASPQWLARYLAAPHEVMPGVTMPDVLGGSPAAERAAAAEALAHFLLSTSPAKAIRVLPDRAAVRRGEALYHKVGCVACHPPQDGTAVPAGSVPLPDMAEKWAFDGLRRFLRDPLAARPSGRMPSMNLSDAEAADIAHYLLRETQVPATIELIEYRGPIRSLEDLDTAEPSRTGPADDFSLDSIRRDHASSLRFAAWLTVDRPGDYTFYLTTVGPGRLGIDGTWRIGGDSWRRQRVEDRIKLHLDAGAHAVTVDYVQRGAKESSLKVEWEGPEVAREAIPAKRLRRTRTPVVDATKFTLDPTKAEKGRALYAALSCAVCHENKAPTDAPASLTALDSARGCLADAPPAAAPNFHLSPAQVESIRRALGDLRRADLPAPSAQQRLAHTMASLRCGACHVRDGAGGPPADRDAYFTSAGEDLGDEGRLPPRLDGVGNKLRPTAIAAALRGAAVRPYLNTRMPQFGDVSVAHLPDLFAQLDRHPLPVKPSPDSADVRRDVGRKLVGTDGLSCIACHKFDRQPGLAMQVVALTTITDRLNEDWFRRFLIDPNHFHPGTRMPSFWPEGKSLLPELLGGDTDRQQAAIWTYLADGGRAKFPEGLSRQNVELVVGGEAVVYRGKLWEAGFRGIATGYQGQLNAAFDAEEVRLSLLWRGRFLNAGPHWTVQGMGQIRPLGTDVVIFPHGSPLAVLGDANAPWPVEAARALGLRFGGYQLDGLKRPTMLYSFGGKRIEDFMTPLDNDKAGLRRTITFLDAPPEHVYLRLAGGKLTPAGAGTWRMNDAITISVKGGAPFVRGAAEQGELIVPIPSTEKPPRLEVDYAW